MHGEKHAQIKAEKLVWKHSRYKTSIQIRVEHDFYSPTFVKSTLGQYRMWPLKGQLKQRIPTPRHHASCPEVLTRKEARGGTREQHHAQPLEVTISRFLFFSRESCNSRVTLYNIIIYYILGRLPDPRPSSFPFFHFLPSGLSFIRLLLFTRSVHLLDISHSCLTLSVTPLQLLSPFQFLHRLSPCSNSAFSFAQISMKNSTTNSFIFSCNPFSNKFIHFFQIHVS